MQEEEVATVWKITWPKNIGRSMVNFCKKPYIETLEQPLSK